MAKYPDPLGERIKAKQRDAKKIFNSVFTSRKDRSNNTALLNEIYEQIRVCEEMCCPIPMDKIEEWINKGDVRKVTVEAWRIKFA